MKKVLKIAIWISLILITLLTGCYLWVRTSWSDIISEKQLDQLTTDIINTKPLPENFKITIKSIYPEIFEASLNEHAVGQLISDRDTQPCPCRLVAKSLNFDLIKAKKSVGNYYPASLTWAIENRVSQEECLAYYLNHYSFTKDVKGIKNASEFYFNDRIESLNIEQQIELIIKLFYPPLYNKEKRPDLFNTEIITLREKVTNYNNIYIK